MAEADALCSGDCSSDALCSGHCSSDALAASSNGASVEGRGRDLLPPAPLMDARAAQSTTQSSSARRASAMPSLCRRV